MATRWKSASRVQTETLDDQNPSNWTASQLKAALGKIGIKITGNLSNSSLRRLYLDNQTKNSSAMMDNSVNLAERNTVSDGNYSLTVSDATIRDPIDINTSDRDVHSTPISTVQQEIATPSTSYAHAIPQLPPTAASAHATINNNNQNVNMQNLLMNTIQLCQQSMQQMNKQGEQIQPSFNLSTALGHGSTSLGIAPSFNSTIPVYSTNSSTPGKFGFPASSFSAVDMVSPELRNDIITGKDVNLNILLIPNYEHSTIKKNKESDVRLQRNLSMDEFVIAFGRYKRIMGTAFPNRNEELDLYLAHIIETANIWPDCFYEYHKMFSAKCAVMLIQHNIKIDWSKGDSDLRNMVCAGSKINKCRKCHSTTHSTVMCSVQQQNFQPQRNSNSSRNTPNSLI
ncbi:unnamed protein product [Mytilus edulis]|uniref:Uncharacterized protein n=1 Tax=Mytilus edulis TaxID=6550 RepID=A0A8S3U8J4_MYTED|nr:unnamed protein product [Mytilus edulis]